MKELSELERKIIVEHAIIELQDSNKRKQIFDGIANTKPSDVKVVKFGGCCGGGMNHYINTQKVSENDLECPICGKPLYIQETSGIAACSDANCKYGHI